ncbi:MAG: LPS export ABC transporter periplasmic protein LptC [Planctomycetes bacterium]|nr:LPS export ABC transporter periplasmic protein LptC [Planctomycetota bacterium]
MRRFIAIFLLAFLPPMALIVWLSTPHARLNGSPASDKPLVGTDKSGLPPRGEHLAENVRIFVYEDDRQLAEIMGASAKFSGRELAVFEKTRIAAWPEKSEKYRQSPAEVHLTADLAEVDQRARTSRMRGHVSVQTPTGDRLDADDLFVNFGKRTLDTDGPVVFVHGESTIRGTGFHGSIALKSFRFEKDVSGSFFGTRADWSPTAAAGPAALPEDVTFSAVGPVTGESTDADELTRRTRITLNGNVRLFRIDPASERPTTVLARTLALDFRRDMPPVPYGAVAWKRTSEFLGKFGPAPRPPQAITAALLAARPTVSLERMEAIGDVSIVDPRAEIEADRVVSESRPDGSGVTLVQGHRKRIVFRDRAAMTMGPLGEVDAPGASGPIEITCVDDLILSRRANSPEGEPGGATVSLSKWVEVRDGARELTADALTIELMPRDGPGGALGYAPRSLEAVGGVIMQEAGRSATADRLRWDVASDTLRLYGRPAAEVNDEKMRLQAARIYFDHRRNVVIADGKVVAAGEGGEVANTNFIKLNPRKSGGSGHWELRCRHLETKTENGELLWLEAAGDLVLTTDDSVITGDALRFYAGMAHVSGHPVRIESGKDYVEARNASVNTLNKTATLYGVRQIFFMMKGGMEAMVGMNGLDKKPADPDAETPVTLTCRGPVYVDQNLGSFFARDCVVVRSGDSRIDTDRLELTFDPATNKLSGARASGRVFLRTPDTAASGNRLVYDVPAATVSLTGVGKVSVWRSSSWLRVDEILIAEGGKSVTFLARYSKGSISFPDKDRSGKPKSDWLKKGPFGDLQPGGEKK